MTYRVLGTTHIQDAHLQKLDEGASDPAPARLGIEKLYWRELNQEVATAIYGSKIMPGMAFDGPAVIRFEATTALIHPGQHARIDSYGNVRNHEQEWDPEMTKTILKIPGSDHFAAQGKRPDPSAISPKLKIFPLTPTTRSTRSRSRSWATSCGRSMTSRARR